ncbi:MAG: DUF2891 domain-containing protein [Marinicellaceae bacterium]
MPIDCVEVEYPNKLNQVLGSEKDLLSPKTLHPAFYGCFDWHSAVHGHWSMVNLIRNFPQLDNAHKIREILQRNITAENIQQEVLYFHGKHNKSWERTYGWAWLLKLAEELHHWDDPLARQLESNLKPLTALMVERFIEFIPKLTYPIRSGEHPNTAFGLTFAFDYAQSVGDHNFVSKITNRAKDFYLSDENCPIEWEPSGFDFLSPCLEEIDIMRRVLNREEFDIWIAKFLPEIKSKEFDMVVGQVSDRSDGKLVHLDGVNFSRAWVLYGLANQYPKYQHLLLIANKHMQYSLPNLVGDSYEGGHWLASFALYALNQLDKD